VLAINQAKCRANRLWRQSFSFGCHQLPEFAHHRPPPGNGGGRICRWCWLRLRWFSTESQGSARSAPGISAIKRRAHNRSPRPNTLVDITASSGSPTTASPRPTALLSATIPEDAGCFGERLTRQRANWFACGRIVVAKFGQIRPILRYTDIIGTLLVASQILSRQNGNIPPLLASERGRRDRRLSRG
jgi:hypothetical protein